MNNNRLNNPLISKYLLKNKISNWKLIVKNSENIFAAVVIPAIAEFENIKKLISALEKNDAKYFENTLIIFVINNLISSSYEIKNENKKSLSYLSSLKSKLKIGFVDASTNGNELPEKDGGVGLARKIGMDLALTYFDYNLSQKKILVCLDADCTVSENYLTEIISNFNKNKFCAAEIYFEHLLNENEENNKAIICYEIFLRYYVLGLKFANSPYAFHTVGSSMACDVESYIKAGGMNKLKAAEDFYFLEKLAKIVTISKINSASVYPSSRGSWRVPFGTGQRVNRFLTNKQDEYLLYSPKSFFVLKEWLKVFLENDCLNSNEYLRKAEIISNSLYNFLVEQNFESGWQNIINNSNSNEQIQKQKKLWFDGFKTLKLIHHLRDKEFPLINMFDALDEMLQLMNIKIQIQRKEENPEIAVQINYLKVLRNFFKDEL